MTDEQLAVARHRAAVWVTVLEVVGAVLIIAGVAWWSIPVGLIVAGAAVLLMAHPIEIPGRWRQ